MHDFESFFTMDKLPDRGNRILTGTSQSLDASLTEFMAKFGGASFNNGLYRVLDVSEINEATDKINLAFPDYTKAIFPFAFDWLNRIFCLDARYPLTKESQCLIFSHLSDEVLQIPAGVSEFHNEILVGHVDEILDVAIFKEFLSAKSRSLITRLECASLIQPLFLNGTYSVENMELIDINIDWEITAEMLLKTRGEKIGAKVNSVT